MEIGEKIRKLRTDVGMTQDELAAKLLVTRTAVSKWERGKGWPGVDSLRLLADEFGCTIDSLVSQEDIVSKRAMEDQASRRLYVGAITCALLAFVSALVGTGGVVQVSQTVMVFCRWAAMWGMIGYVMLSFAFSRANERVGWKRVLASRIVVIVIILLVMLGFVGVAGSVG